MRSLMASIFLILLPIITSVAIKVSGNAYVTKCGFPPKPFNKSTHICCNFQIVPRIVGGSEQRCCGDNVRETVYQYPSQKCCGIQVRNVTEIESGEYECCGHEFIWKGGNDFCCADRRYTPREFKKRPDTNCCGQTPYNNDDQLCCKGIVRWRRNSQNIDCCGNDTYDKSKEDCDGIKRVPKLKDNFKTCAGNSYDPNIYVCCKGNIVKMPEGYNVTMKPTCCGNTIIMDEKEEDCSRSRVVPKGHISCQSGSIDPITDLCCDDVPYYDVTSTSKCCGKKIITKQEKCCNEKSGLAYDGNNYQCCGGDVIPKSESCCNGRKFNTKEKLCCQGRFGGFHIVNKENDKQSKCCYTQPYDEVTEKCVQGIIQPKNKVFVCSGVLFTNVTEDFRCCYKTAYNPKKKSCCYKTTYNPKIKSCCGKRTYNRKSHGCYGGKVMRKIRDRPIVSTVACEPSTKWTRLSELNINCTNSQVFLMKNIAKSKQKAKKNILNKNYKIRRMFVGESVKGSKRLRLIGKCNEIRKARSFIFVKSNMTSPESSVSFVKNNKNNRRLAKVICKQTGKS